MKPLIFVGDSWTFGEGLELYNDNFRKFAENFCKTNKVEYHWPQVEDISEGGSAAALRFTNRFPTLVSNHFNTFYISSGINGGDNSYAIDYIHPIIEKYGEDNFSYIIIQFTDMFRDTEFHFKKLINRLNPNNTNNLNSIRRFLNLWQAWDYSKMGKFIEDLNKYNQLTNDGLPHVSYKDACLLQREYKTYENFILNIQISQYDSYYQSLCKYKIPVICIGTWSKEDSNIIKNLNIPSVNFFKDNMITLENNKIITNYLSDLIDFNSNEYPYDDMLICNVWKWTVNSHPTKKFHKIIANSLIKHINNLDNQK